MAPVIVQQVAKLIQRLQESGLTIPLSEQNTHFAGCVSQRASIIECGYIRLSGTMRDVLDEPALRKTYPAV